MQTIRYSEAVCELALVRLDQIQRDFSHAGLAGVVAGHVGLWSENLAREGSRIRGERGVFRAWLHSAKHKAILEFPIQEACVVHGNGYWVFLGFNPVSF